MLFHIYIYINLNIRYSKYIYIYILYITYQIDTCILDTNIIYHIFFKLFGIHYIYIILCYIMLYVYIQILNIIC